MGDRPGLAHLLKTAFSENIRERIYSVPNSPTWFELLLRKAIGRKPKKHCKFFLDFSHEQSFFSSSYVIK